MNVSKSWGLGLVLAATPLCAQQMPAVPRLEVVGRAQAFGGQVEQVAIAGDGRHMLTKGAAGDLFWWDLRELRLLGRYEAPGFFWAFALHPREPWALVTIGGSLQRLDLETGEWQPQPGVGAWSLAFDDAGDNVAMVISGGGRRQLQVCPADRLDRPLWHRAWDLSLRAPMRFDGDALVFDLFPDTHTAQRWRVRLNDSDPVRLEEATPVASLDAVAIDARGEYAAWITTSIVPEVVQARPTPKRWSLHRYTDGWLEEVCAASDGTLVVADNIGQLLVLGPGEQVRVASAHRGAAVGAVWSPDGNFLAVQGLGALRVIDRTGATVGEFVGSHGVAPGEEGAAFVLFDHDRITWWDAASRKVTAEVAFHGDPPRRVTEDVARRGRNPAPTLHLGDGWLVAAGRGESDTAWNHFEAAGRVKTYDPGGLPWDVEELEPCAAAGVGDGRALVAWASYPNGCGQELLARTWSMLRLVDAAGAPIDELRLGQYFGWLRVAPSRDFVLFGSAWGGVLRIDPDDLAHPVEVVPESAGWAPLDWFEFVGPHGALAGDRDTTWWIDTRTWDCARIALPPGVPQARGSALSPDGRHLALFAGPEVWIVAIR